MHYRVIVSTYATEKEAKYKANEFKRKNIETEIFYSPKSRSYIVSLFRSDDKQETEKALKYYKDKFGCMNVFYFESEY